MLNRGVDRETRFSLKDYQALPPQRVIEDLLEQPAAGMTLSGRTLDKEPYVPNTDLVEAVNLALTLRRPLLLQGDPGCGKTRLASAVAYGLGWPLEAAYIKSTSRAQDLLYSYDAVGRLYDAQLGIEGPRDPTAPDQLRFRSAMHYISLGPFGRAIKRAGLGQPSVVLIDEIDKADLDFPNDLLREIEDLRFEISETGQFYEAGPDIRTHPLVIVTNNEEKALPNAFLRRCIFHIVTIPTEPRLLRAILAAHNVGSQGLIAEATEIYQELVRIDSLTKKPGLSELLDWVRYHSAQSTSPKALGRVPAPGALFKQPADLERLQRWLKRDATI